MSENDKAEENNLKILQKSGPDFKIFGDIPDGTGKRSSFSVFWEKYRFFGGKSEELANIPDRQKAFL